ncbi:MAG: class I SAM-dependent methyltransferase [Actinomycetota bacterium]|nr:class I SAM-dependent methyltransferase [Actinomycetota bacterium]
MTGPSLSNDEIWKSRSHVAEWASSAEERERGRERARAFIAELLPFDAADEFVFADLGAGTGAAARAVLDAYPRARAVLADYSSEMMDEGRRALGAYAGRYEYVVVDLALGEWPEEVSGGLAAIVSSLCVHHVTDGRKQALFGEVFGRLAPGGWYVNYDPVSAPDPVAEEAWRRVADARDPVGAARRRSRTTEEHARWENHVRHIAPLEPQLAWMRAAGFDAVDAYWKELDHVVFAGRRPPG